MSIGIVGRKPISRSISTQQKKCYYQFTLASHVDEPREKRLVPAALLDLPVYRSGIGDSAGSGPPYARGGGRVPRLSALSPGDMALAKEFQAIARHSSGLAVGGGEWHTA